MSFSGGERIRQISTPLPPGEHVRWEGVPDWRSLAVHVFHARKALLYCLAIGLVRGALAWQADRSLPVAIGSVVFLALLGAAAAGCSVILALVTARTTVYAVTDRRVVMRIGVVVSWVVNIPFRQIEHVQLRERSRGTADLALALSGADRLAYFQLWPHARPWHIGRPQPMLRAVPDGARVGAVLREAILAAGEPGVPAPAPADPPTAAAAPLRRAAAAPAAL
jgi:hypothetical protein